MIKAFSSSTPQFLETKMLFIVMKENIEVCKHMRLRGFVEKIEVEVSLI
jgi:hypothetical protein